MGIATEIAKVSAKTAIETAAPMLMDAGAKAFCEAIPLDWLEKVIMRHHDDYGEFAYAACARDIKARLVKQAKKEEFSKARTK